MRTGENEGGNEEGRDVLRMKRTKEGIPVWITA
jgi:hypothetical protein